MDLALNTLQWLIYAIKPNQTELLNAKAILIVHK